MNTDGLRSEEAEAATEASRLEKQSLLKNLFGLGLTALRLCVSICGCRFCLASRCRIWVHNMRGSDE